MGWGSEGEFQRGVERESSKREFERERGGGGGRETDTQRESPKEECTLQLTNAKLDDEKASKTTVEDKQNPHEVVPDPVHGFTDLRPGVDVVCIEVARDAAHGRGPCLCDLGRQRRAPSKADGDGLKLAGLALSPDLLDKGDGAQAHLEAGHDPDRVGHEWPLSSVDLFAQVIDAAAQLPSVLDDLVVLDQLFLPLRALNESDGATAHDPVHCCHALPAGSLEVDAAVEKAKSSLGHFRVPLRLSERERELHAGVVNRPNPLLPVVIILR